MHEVRAAGAYTWMMEDSSSTDRPRDGAGGAGSRPDWRFTGRRGTAPGGRKAEPAAALPPEIQQRVRQMARERTGELADAGGMRVPDRPAATRDATAEDGAVAALRTADAPAVAAAPMPAERRAAARDGAAPASSIGAVPGIDVSDLIPAVEPAPTAGATTDTAEHTQPVAAPPTIDAVAEFEQHSTSTPTIEVPAMTPLEDTLPETTTTADRAPMSEAEKKRRAKARAKLKRDRAKHKAKAAKQNKSKSPTKVIAAGVPVPEPKRKRIFGLGARSVEAGIPPTEQSTETDIPVASTAPATSPPPPPPTSAPEPDPAPPSAPAPMPATEVQSTPPPPPPPPSQEVAAAIPQAPLEAAEPVPVDEPIVAIEPPTASVFGPELADVFEPRAQGEPADTELEADADPQPLEEPGSPDAPEQPTIAATGSTSVAPSFAARGAVEAADSATWELGQPPITATTLQGELDLADDGWGAAFIAIPVDDAAPPPAPALDAHAPAPDFVPPSKLRSPRDASGGGTADEVRARIAQRRVDLAAAAAAMAHLDR